MEPEEVLKLIGSAAQRYDTVRAALRYRGNGPTRKEFRARIVRTEAGRRVFGEDVVKQAMGEAMDVKRLLRESSGLDPFVHAILCFSRAEVSCYKPLGNVEATNLGSPNRAVVDRPERYSPKEVRQSPTCWGRDPA